MGNITLSAVTAVGVTTLTFNPALARVVRPRLSPIQVRLLAEGGQQFVFERSGNEELVLPLEFEDIPEDDETTPVSTSGYNSLSDFLRRFVDWSKELFVLTDADGDVYEVRYWGGFEDIREAGGRTSKQKRWSGTLQLRTFIPAPNTVRPSPAQAAWAIPTPVATLNLATPPPVSVQWNIPTPTAT